jgi:Ca-activated chloride channel family protein
MPLAILAIGACSFLIALYHVHWSLKDLFLTPDQRGRILMNHREYKKAAGIFEDPLQRGAALYRTGNFKEAAASFGQDDSAEAFYNRANALVMLGNYEQAIAGYKKALAMKPGWKEAADNLELAVLRNKRLHPPNDPSLGTDGMLKANKIVFDNQAKNSNQKQTVSGAQQQLSDEELRAMWLRRVQTQPADFLRAKFSYQAFLQSSRQEEQKEKK